MKLIIIDNNLFEFKICQYLQNFVMKFTLGSIVELIKRSRCGSVNTAL